MSKTNWREAYEKDPLNTLIRYLRHYTPQNAPDLDTLVYDYYRRLHINLHPIPVRHNPRIYIPGTRDMVTPHILVDNTFPIFFFVLTPTRELSSTRTLFWKLKVRIRKALEHFDLVILYFRYWQGMNKKGRRALKYLRKSLEDLRKELGDQLILLVHRSRSYTTGGPRSFPRLAKYPWVLPGFNIPKSGPLPGVISPSTLERSLIRLLASDEEDEEEEEEFDV